MAKKSCSFRTPALWAFLPSPSFYAPNLVHHFFFHPSFSWGTMIFVQIWGIELETIQINYEFFLGGEISLLVHTMLESSAICAIGFLEMRSSCVEDFNKLEYKKNLKVVHACNMWGLGCLTTSCRQMISRVVVISTFFQPYFLLKALRSSKCFTSNLNGIFPLFIEDYELDDDFNLSFNSFKSTFNLFN